jgi:ankyrin repeat protein
MGSSWDKDESEEAGSADAVHAEHNPARRRRVYSEQIKAREERRKRLLEQDALGRTPLFYAAEKGLAEEVWDIIFSFRGTGLMPPRLALIAKEDHSGLTAADVAEQNGHEEIASLLRSEQVRMEYYE